MKKETVCEYAYASVDGTKCEAFTPWISCPSDYAIYYTAKTCPELKPKRKKE